MSPPIPSGWHDPEMSTGALDPWAFESRVVEKPWGHELIWALSDVYCGKVLFVKAGESLSLQYHEQKDESWLIQSGRARIELGVVGDDELAIECGSWWEMLASAIDFWEPAGQVFAVATGESDVSVERVPEETAKAI